MANGSDNLIPTFVGDTTNGWQAYGAGFLYIAPATITNKSSTLTIQAFTATGGAATIELFESNRNALTSFNAMIDADDVAIATTIGADENVILRSPDIIRCKYLGVYVENVTNDVEFATAIR